ncbi:hypothetical protein AB0F71_37555 [Kitasatospora sp. NPDC028055]|uniref:hypothetical protein n=1 Tax=Kitasatospora sp. NPDC028055 TaxID=3155653 RepID=UPI00340B902F
MAARSTHVTLHNFAGVLNLRLTATEIGPGVFTTQPPQLIGDRGEWESESDGFLTGTEGRVTYQIEDVDGVRQGEMSFHWDNPFTGANSYEESVTPAATGATSGGFSVVHLGGSGNNTTVEVQLLKGFCQANQDTGEIVCASADPLTGTSQRFAAIFEQSQGPSFHAVHDLTADQYQQTFDTLTGQGFRPVWVSGYAVDAVDRYAAIFEQRDGPPFAAFHRLTADQYQQTFNDQVAQGFRPIDVSGYAVNGGDLYAAIFEQQSGPPFAAFHRLSADQYQQTFNDQVAQGFRPVHVSGYAVNGGDLYAAIFEQRNGPPFAAFHRLSADQYQQTFKDQVAQGFRPIDVSGYTFDGGDHYAAIFEQQSTPPFAAFHRLSADQYQQTFNDQVAQGFRLTRVSGYSL